MTKREVVIHPIDVNENLSLPADWFSRTRKLSPGLVKTLESETQQLEIETVATLNVSGEWNIKTACDPLQVGLMNEEQRRRLELIRAAAEARK